MRKGSVEGARRVWQAAAEGQLASIAMEDQGNWRLTLPRQPSGAEMETHEAEMCMSLDRLDAHVRKVSQSESRKAASSQGGRRRNKKPKRKARGVGKRLRLRVFSHPFTSLCAVQKNVHNASEDSRPLGLRPWPSAAGALLGRHPSGFENSA